MSTNYVPAGDRADCGCSGDNSGFYFCKLHAAAPELFKAYSDLLAKVSFRQKNGMGQGAKFTSKELDRFRAILDKAVPD